MLDAGPGLDQRQSFVSSLVKSEKETTGTEKKVRLRYT